MKITLKAARTNKNLTLEQASNRLEIAVDTLSKYERGITFPDVLLLKKIEDVYEISYNEIIFLNKNNDLIVKKEV